MFKFDFDIEEVDEEIQGSIPAAEALESKEESSYIQVSFQEHSLSDLLSSMLSHP